MGLNFDWDPWDPEKSQEYENLKIDMILNPFGVLGPINSVFDDFSRFRPFLVLFARFFKNGLENLKFLLFTTYKFLESWGRTLFGSTKIFQIRGHLRS